MTNKEGEMSDDQRGNLPRDKYLNMEIWLGEKKTPKEHTKKVTFGRKFTSVCPQYQLQCGTARFGPYGKTWGLRDISWQIVEQTLNDVQMDYYRRAMEDAKTIKDAEKVNRKMLPTLVFSATFFYPGGEFPIVVDGPFERDDESYKKLMTGARSKAMSYLGFSADIYLGQYDDVQYVSGVSEYTEKQDERFTTAVKMIDEAKDVNELDRLELNLKNLENLSHRDELLQRIDSRRGRLDVAAFGHD